MGNKSTIDYLLEFKKISELDKIRRSNERAARAHELERKNREKERSLKKFEKERKIRDAENEVDEYDERLKLVLFLHKYVETKYVWDDFFNHPPQKPVNARNCEGYARSDLSITRFSIWDKITGGDKKYKANKIQEAIQQDDEIYNPELQKYEAEFKEWKENKLIGEEVLKGNVDSYFLFIKKCNPFSIFSVFLKDFKIEKITKSFMEIEIEVFDEDIVPKEIKELNRNNTVSVKPKNQNAIFPMYVNYVCGCSLRVARELFAMFPISKVIIHTNKKLIDRSTGNFNIITIQSIYIHKIIIDKMNFELLNPLSSMKHFPYKTGMDFENDLFTPVNKLTFDDINKYYEKVSRVPNKQTENSLLTSVAKSSTSAIGSDMGGSVIKGVSENIFADKKDESKKGEEE